MRVAPPGLADRAEQALRAGPVHALELARGVLKLSGPRGALTAAVTALLGCDRRFEVDAQGRWSLTGASGPALRALRYAVVDVEATGGSREAGHRIIEIGVVEVCGGQLGDVWTTLVNPGRTLPPGVEALTGITGGLLAGAPWFEHVAHDVFSRLEGRVFVAHNAAFDWRLVSAELAEAVGAVPRVDRLCTVRMARRLAPKLRRRNLDALARHYGIVNHARHRAGGDALATAQVLIRLLEAAYDRGLRDLTGLHRFLDGPPRRPRRRAVDA